MGLCLELLQLFADGGDLFLERRDIADLAQPIVQELLGASAFFLGSLLDAAVLIALPFELGQGKCRELSRAHRVDAGAHLAQLTREVVDQLAQLNVKPEQITFVGISHFHADHTGQVASFPKATLLIGKGDWDAITAPKPAAGVNFAPFEGWIKGDNKVEPQPVDKDVFGDGSVMMLYTPGHTPGHHSLLVKLPQAGNFLISGDAVHFRENYDTDGVPAFNFDRAETLASISRMKKIVEVFKATLVIQHDARDIGKLPAFPAGAK